MSDTLHPQTPMRRALEVFPGAQRALFRRYHIGGCASCGFEPEESLEGLCRRNGLDVAEVIRHIEFRLRNGHRGGQSGDRVDSRQDGRGGAGDVGRRVGPGFGSVAAGANPLRAIVESALRSALRPRPAPNNAPSAAPAPALAPSLVDKFTQPEHPFSKPKIVFLGRGEKTP